MLLAKRLTRPKAPGTRVWVMKHRYEGRIRTLSSLGDSAQVESCLNGKLDVFRESYNPLDLCSPREPVKGDIVYWPERKMLMAMEDRLFPLSPMRFVGVLPEPDSTRFLNGLEEIGARALAATSKSALESWIAHWQPQVAETLRNSDKELRAEFARETVSALSGIIVMTYTARSNATELLESLEP